MKKQILTFLGQASEVAMTAFFVRDRRHRGDMFEMLEPKFVKEATSWNLEILEDQARIAMVTKHLPTNSS